MTTSTTVDGVTTRTREVEWDDEQRDWMVALAAWEDALCPVCGGPIDECQSPEAEFAWKGAPPVRCHRTDAMLMWQEKAADYKRPKALLWRAVKRD